MTEEKNPIDLDTWFTTHVLPNINKIEREDGNYYRINVALCYNRHHFRDNNGERVLFSVFPKWLDAPNLMRPNYPHVVRFLTALENHIREIDPDDKSMVSLNLYLSGATGPVLAFYEAYYGPEAPGIAYWRRPNNWFLTFCSFNSQNREYENERSLFDSTATI